MSTMPSKRPHTPVPQDVSLLPVLRALAKCQQQISRVTLRHMESMGLTPAQFDVLATLGDEPGMTCKQLGEQSLITRGTLIPVLDRLEAKGLVQRSKSEKDSRQTIVSLTPEGQALYEQVFMPHVDYVRPFFDRALSAEEQQLLVSLLGRVEQAFAEGAPEGGGGCGA
jgi:DNA-binding MarR family transcriptional regulator